MTAADDPDRDVLVGADAIARELGISKIAVYRMYRDGHLPIGKLGRLLVASRIELRRAVQQKAAR